MKDKYVLGLVLFVVAFLAKGISGIDPSPGLSIHGVSAEMTNEEVASASASLFKNVIATVPMEPCTEIPYVLWNDGKYVVVVGDQMEVGEQVIKSGESASKLLDLLGHPKKITPINGAFENWHYGNRFLVRVSPIDKTILKFVLSNES